MKVKNIKVGIKPLEHSLKEFADTWKKLEEGKEVSKHEAVYFESIDALRAVLTDKRLELLKAIKENRPNSIYELAKIVGRDIKNVNEDVRLLADLGFVKLEKRKTDRKRTVPTVDYSSIMLEIRL